MRTIRLNKIVEQHQHWLKKDCEGWEDMRANLCGANLCDANLRGANLCGAENISSVLSNACTAFFAIGCPEKGAFTAFKKCGFYIVELAKPSAPALHHESAG